MGTLSFVDLIVCHADLGDQLKKFDAKATKFYYYQHHFNS